MKKLSILLALMMTAVLVFTACGSNDEEVTVDETAQESNGEKGTGEESDGPAELPAADLDLNNLDNAAQGPQLDPPELDYTSGISEDGFYENITAAEHVVLINYYGMEVPAETHTVDETIVESQVEQLMSQYNTVEKVTDRAIADGDSINMDFVGSIDGVEFEGGSTGGMGAEVTIGVDQYIDDFLEQLIGHMPGESFDIEVTFPENYGVEELNGKDAVFAITLNFIIDVVEPELTDEFVAENLAAIYDWTTIDEMKDEIRNGIQEYALKNFLQGELLASVEVTDMPEAVMEYQKRAMTNYYEENAYSYNMELLDFIKANTEHETLEALYEASQEELTEMAGFSLLLQAIAQDAGILVTDEVLGDYFEEYYGSRDYSQFEDMYGKGYLKFSILQELVLDHLVENAKLL